MQGRRPFNPGRATGKVITVRTKPFATALNPNACSPETPLSISIFRIGDGGSVTTAPGETTDYAVVEAGGTKILVTANHDAAGVQLLESLGSSPN